MEKVFEKEKKGDEMHKRIKSGQRWCRKSAESGRKWRKPGRSCHGWRQWIRYGQWKPEYRCRQPEWREQQRESSEDRRCSSDCSGRRDTCAFGRSSNSGEQKEIQILKLSGSDRRWLLWWNEKKRRMRMKRAVSSLIWRQRCKFWMFCEQNLKIVMQSEFSTFTIFFNFYILKSLKTDMSSNRRDGRCSPYNNVSKHE